MIHYVTQNGIGNAWVANELSRVEGAGLPVALHAMRAPDKLLHDSPWAVEMNRRTELMYPLPLVVMFLSLLAAPFRFRSRFFSALWNAFFGRREHLRAHREFRKEFFVHTVAQSWTDALRNASIRTNNHFRFDDVVLPIALARRDITRQ